MKKMTTIRGKEEEKKGMPTWQKVAIGALLGAAAGGAIYLVWRHKTAKLAKLATIAEHADDVKAIADTAAVVTEATEAAEAATDILKATGSADDAVNIAGLIHDFVVDNDFFMDFVNAGGRITWEAIPAIGEEAACIGEAAVAVSKSIEAIDTVEDLAKGVDKAIQMGVF